MMLEWIRIGAVSPEVHESLQSRFMRCRADNRKDHVGRAGQTRRQGRERSQIATGRR
jgi:hypothetical protein